jgi:hypothetical protein
MAGLFSRLTPLLKYNLHAHGKCLPMDSEKWARRSTGAPISHPEKFLKNELAAEEPQALALATT